MILIETTHRAVFDLRASNLTMRCACKPIPSAFLHPQECRRTLVSSSPERQAAFQPLSQVDILFSLYILFSICGEFSSIAIFSVASERRPKTFSSGMKSGRILSKFPARPGYDLSEDLMTNLFEGTGKDIVPPGSGSSFESYIELRKRSCSCWSSN